jgi:exodeoxyribonuclease V alpha subunit
VDIIKGMVVKSYPNQQLLMVQVEEDEIMAKGVFDHLYPGDLVFLKGEFRKRKGLGPIFRFDAYREIEHDFRLAKWLKVSMDLSDSEVIEAIVEKKGIHRVWDEIEHRETFLSLLRFLEEKEVSFEAIAKIERDFQWKVPSLFKNPYQLLQYIDISFDMLKRALRACNLDKLDETKGQYTLEQLLKKANEQGHFYVPREKVVAAFQKEKMQFKKVWIGDKFLEKNDKIYLRDLYDLEKRIADSIVSRIKTIPAEDGEGRVSRWEEGNGFTLAQNQREAVVMALVERFCIVTGGPGVGKTTVCKCITDLMGEAKDILMVAPTGRAAKRAKESTGLPATTIHKLLEFNGIRFNRNEHNPIETDVLVIDESSMVDAYLLDALLKALPHATTIIFVGDVDQLPSVGPGEILRDMIESGVVPVTRLTEVFRQAADSPIISCAYDVNEGKLPTLASNEDLKYIVGEDDCEVADETVRIASEWYRKEDLFDVQILIPMYAGEAGIDAVNRRIQDILNPTARGVTVKHYELREGDKIIATKNDSAKDISNGDVGKILRIEETTIVVQFQGEEREVPFSREEWGVLQLSYAVTVHRAQGSEYRYCIIPLASGYKKMLQKNLFYTAITRAKKKCWIIFEEEALRRTVRKESVPKRNTSIKWLLREKGRAVS